MTTVVKFEKMTWLCACAIASFVCACGAPEEADNSQNASSNNSMANSDANNATSSQNNADSANQTTSPNNATSPANNTSFNSTTAPNNATTPANQTSPPINQTTPANTTPAPTLACDGEENCVDTFPQLLSDTTVGGEANLGSYSCSPETNEGGAERLYKVILQQPGFLAARISGEPEGVDIDIHILSAPREDACIDRGHFTAGAFLDAGEYWVSADSWVDADGKAYEGSFELELNLVQRGDWATFGISSEVAGDAFDAFITAWEKDETKHLEYAITDFSIYSSSERLWVVDLASDTQRYHLTVGHGIGSVEGDDLGNATLFSNTPASEQSSLGLMRGAEIYVGDFGYSMRLDGLEPGFNDNVRRRDIVIHPDERNAPEVTAMNGYLAPSRGCPTLDPATSKEVIDLLAEGGLFFFWYPDDAWRGGSAYLQ